MSGGAAAQTDTKQARYPELTLLSVILMLLVIYSHAATNAVAEYDRAGALYLFTFVTKKLCGCAVPGFLFLSGSKHIMSRGGEGYGQFLIKKARRTIPPYVFWVVMYYLYFVSRDYFAFELGALLRYIADGTLVAPMYFVIVILQFYITMPLWRGLAKTTSRLRGKVLALTLVLVLSAVIMHLSKHSERLRFMYSDRIFTSFLYYWLLGVVCGANYKSVMEFIRKRRAVLIPAELLVIIAHTALWYLDSRELFKYSIAEPAQIVFATALLFFALDMCVLATRRQLPLKKLVTALDNAGYNIFLMHCLVLFIVDGIAPNLGITANFAARLIFAIAISSAICIGYNSAKKKALGGIKHA